MATQAIHVYDCMLYKKKCFSVENIDMAMFVDGLGRNEQ
jgi:hypothetical protein